MSNITDNQSSFLLYTGNDGAVRLDVFLENETVWLTQKTMPELFAVGVPAVSKPLANIYESGELQQGTTISKMETVQMEELRAVRRK